MTADQDRIRRSTEAYRTLGHARLDIAERLEAAHAGAAVQTPRRPGTLSGSRTDGPADPVHAQVARLEQHLRARGGPLHRTGLLLAHLDDLAAAIAADHRLPPRFVDQVAIRRPSVRRGPVGAPLHELGRLADQIGDQLGQLNEAVYDRWRQMWRGGEDRYGTVLDQALLAYSSAASYAASLARSLEPFVPVRDDRPRCGQCGYRLVKYPRLQLCDSCYKTSARAL